MTTGPAAMRVEIEGAAATVERLSAVAPAGYGHFTAMQVRDHRVRGLGLHLARLDAANLELFDVGLDPGQVRDHIRHALGAGTPDASVRVYVCEAPGGPSVLARLACWLDDVGQRLAVQEPLALVGDEAGRAPGEDERVAADVRGDQDI